jgi:2-methylcitrate dehydratase PrpD
VDEHGLQTKDITNITLFVGRTEEFAVCEPLASKRNPATLGDAQMSLPYSVAVAMVKGKPCLKHFKTESFRDPEVLRLSNRVDFRVSPEYGAHIGTPIVRAAMEVRLGDGRILRSDRQVVRYGHPENPMGMEEHIEKFRDCVSYLAKPLGKDREERLIEMLIRLEELDDVREIVRVVS